MLDKHWVNLNSQKQIKRKCLERLKGVLTCRIYVLFGFNSMKRNVGKITLIHQKNKIKSWFTIGSHKTIESQCRCCRKGARKGQLPRCSGYVVRRGKSTRGPITSPSQALTPKELIREALWRKWMRPNMKQKIYVLRRTSNTNSNEKQLVRSIKR